MLVAAIAILVALTIANFILTKRVLHPSVVYSATWLIQTIGLISFRDRFTSPSEEVFLMVVLGAISFSVGSHISSINILGSGNLIKRREVRRSPALFAIAALVVAVCLYGQYDIFSKLLTDDSFSNTLVYARTLMSIDNDDIYGFYKYGSPIAIGMLIALQLLIVRGESSILYKAFAAFFFAAALCMAVMSTGRGPIAHVFLLVGLIYILCGEQERVGRRVGGIVAALSVLVFGIFWVMGQAMGKVEVEAVSALSSLVDYLFSSIPALSVYVSSNPIEVVGGDWGNNTFRFVYAVAATAGMADKPPSLVQEFMPVPHLTNLYTVYLPYVKDFGWAGVVVIPLALGAAYGRLFSWSTEIAKDELAYYFLAISYLPLLQSVFQETYFSLMSSWIQFFLIGFVVTKVSRSNDMASSYAR